MFRKILIANRGEIAVRIIRACRDLGIRAAVIYSDPDRKGLPVQLADEAYRIGPAPALESYLAMERIVEVAKKCGAEAIHPGYGFLAENARFAEQVEKAGIRFIGPPIEAIEKMGDKTEARKLARQVGVPTIPGTVEPVQTAEEARKVADSIGYPVLLKAAAGGGGKGMRLVEKAEEMESAFRGAQSEARSAFGDGRIYIEKYLKRPRHIEIQILADQHGHAIHLHERECSIQRRHQKLVEESPSVLVTPELRRKMGEAAVALARAAGYTNAGTVEFLVDEDRNFYFLEMNTRLQVEHPVTEWITGIDLVEEQLRIAAGEPLRWKQEDIPLRGHAIEVRVYAEDPASGFLPSTGKIQFLREPSGPGIRCDSGIYAGCTVEPYYDPLLAKLIVWGRDRTEALRRLHRALREYQIFGVETTLPFFLRLVEHPAFQKGELSTHFLQEHGEELMNGSVKEDEAFIGALVSVWAHAQARQKARVETDHREPESNWKRVGREWMLRGL